MFPVVTNLDVMKKKIFYLTKRSTTQVIDCMEKNFHRFFLAKQKSVQNVRIVKKELNIYLHLLKCKYNNQIHIKSIGMFLCDLFIDQLSASHTGALNRHIEDDDDVLCCVVVVVAMRKPNIKTRRRKNGEKKMKLIL